MSVLGVLCALLFAIPTRAHGSSEDSPDVQQATAKLVTTANDTLEHAVQFIQEQTPDVAQQLVQMRLYDSAVPTIISAVLTFISCLGMLFCLKLSAKDDDWVCGVMCFAIAAGIGGIICGCWIPQLLECIYTPKAILFLEMRHLL